MAAQAQPDSNTDRLFVQAGSPRCPICQQTLPDHLNVKDLEVRLLERETRAAKAQETSMRAHLEEEQEAKRDKAVAGALVEQREALDNAKTEAVNQVKAEEFAKSLKLQQKLSALQRQLDQKTSNELGEGAEIDLYDALRSAFEDDRIKRVKKGDPGADIRHDVVYSDQVIGSILFDSKNHGAWRTSFVDKLKNDQLAGDADHAVLATSVFPSGERQLLVRDGVIVVNPARAVELVRLLRQHIIQTHRLRISAEERDDKTRALYEFIVSERYGQLIARFDTLAEVLLELDVSEKKAHDTVWRKRGMLLKDAQKVHGDLASEIDRIVAGDQS